MYFLAREVSNKLKLVSVEFGVGLAPVEPLKRIVWLAKTAEQYGYKYFVHADQRFNGERDVFVTLAADALNTQSINLGPCISDPYTRIPAMLATGIASLDELSDHRALLTLGSGGVGFKQLHLERKHPNAAIREAFLIIKALLQGNEVNYEGQMYKVSGAKINFPSRNDIPMFIASRSPMNLELGGEIADGVLLASFASEAQISYALEKVKAGAKKAKRDFKGIKLIAWVYTSISENSQQALDNVRPFVTQALVNTAVEMYPAMFDGFPREVRQFVEACKISGDLKKAYEDRRYLTDDVIKRFSVAGTTEECAEKIRSIAKLGVRTVWIRPFSAPFSERDHEKVFIPFAEKVMPEFH
jgi:5,10-methylenetetrahydromethanopterin reductase